MKAAKIKQPLNHDFFNGNWHAKDGRALGILWVSWSGGLNVCPA
jgi:hypothetical protein